MTSFDGPSSEAPDDPLLSSEDLRLRWLELMSPLGFGDRTLWMALLGPDRRMQKALTPMPARTPDDSAQVFRVIFGVCDRRRAGFDDGTTVAFLLTRPGFGSTVDSDDLHWADVVIEAAARHRVPIEPFFRANDASVVEVSPRRGS